MKNIFSIFSIENIKNNLKIILKRFSVSLLLIIVLNIILFTLVHGDFTNLKEEQLIKLVFSLIITFFFSVGVYISTENLGIKNLKKQLFQIIPIVFGTSFFFSFKSTLNDFENVIFICLSLAGIISYIFFAPYLNKVFRKAIKQSSYYSYFYKISVIFLLSAILGGILAALGAIGITAIFELFDLSYIYQDEIYGDWMIIALSFIPSIFALTKIPNKKDLEKNNFELNVFFSFLIKYIFIPFVYAYFIILYMYSAKVLLNFNEWPKGEVSWIVIGFSILGYITYLFSYSFEKDFNFIRIFRKYLPFVVFPQLFMLFYAIYLRINQYDLTVNRYFVAIFGLWLAVITIYYIFSRKKYLYFIFSILTIFTIVISIGPWSVYSLPETRQLNRLKQNMEKAGILNNGNIIPLSNYADIDQDLSKNIYSGIDYLCDFSNCSIIKSLFSEQYNKLEKEQINKFEKNKQDNIKDYKEKIQEFKNKDDDENIKKYEKYLEKSEKEIFNGVSKWTIVNNITDYIKVEYYNHKNDYLELRINYNDDVFPIDIDGYSKIYEISNYDNNDGIYAFIDLDKKIIELKNNTLLIKTINITSIIDSLNDNYSESNDNLSRIDLTFEIDNFKVIFKSISFYKGNDDNNGYVNGYLLEK